MRSISGARRASTARSMSFASASSAAPPGFSEPASSTTSVRTGTSRSSCRTSLMACHQVVVADLVAARLVEPVAAAAGLASGVLGGYHLQQPLEALEMRRAVLREVEDQLAFARAVGVGGDQDRRFGRERIVRRAVRHEADRRPGPQQLVDAAGGFGLRRVDQHALFLRQRLAGEAAGDLEPVRRVEIKIYRRHGSEQGNPPPYPYFFPA